MTAVPVRDGVFVIVGGASLVGSHTAGEFLRRGAREVRVLDNFAWGAEAALDHLRGDARLRLVRGDVLRLPDLLAAMDGADGALLLAAAMTLGMDRDPWGALDVNVRGVQNALEAASVRGVRKAVFASSNAAYGYGPGVLGELTEATPFHSAGAPPAAILYGATKLIGEQLCRQYEARRGLSHVTLRYSTVYGERQHHRAANALYIIETIERLARGEPPEIAGDGTDTKHFVHAEDLARANARAFEAAASGVALNCSGPEVATTRELVAIITELMGSDLAPRFTDGPAGRVRLGAGGAFRIANEAAREAIGWAPEIGLREGLARLIAWHREGRTT